MQFKTDHYTPLLVDMLTNKLIPALESGWYHHGTGALKTIHNGNLFHCCLGVMCELDHNVTWIEASEDTNEQSAIYTMPKSLRTAFTIESETPTASILPLIMGPVYGVTTELHFYAESSILEDLGTQKSWLRSIEQDPETLEWIPLVRSSITSVNDYADSYKNVVTILRRGLAGDGVVFCAGNAGGTLRGEPAKNYL